MKWKYFNKEHNYDEKYEDESENSCDTVKSGAVTSIFFTVRNQPILCYINCPMFGFQSLSSTVWCRIHKGIIWTSTLRILLSLFDILSLFDTSSRIDIFLILSPIYWLVCLQRREKYSQLSYNLFHP